MYLTARLSLLLIKREFLRSKILLQMRFGFSIRLPQVKPQLHCHDFGHDGATTHPDLSSRDASA